MNFQNKKLNIYFIGIGGISMSAIAYILKNAGHNVSGSDMQESDEVKILISRGIYVNIGHSEKNIDDKIDLVVYSKAIHNDNPEMITARKKGIHIMSRSEILGEIMTWYEKCICVAGTHGKTTTTSCISKVFLDEGYDPTINIGGIVPDIGGNYHIGLEKNVFIAEACEYTNSFLDFHPTCAVITNVEEDHLDFFKDINDIRNSFRKFIETLHDGGLLIINGDIDNVKSLYENKNIDVITYGMDKKSDYYINNLSYDDTNYLVYDIYRHNEKLFTMRQRLIGVHNALNVLASIILLIYFGIDIDTIKKDLCDFTGAKRRLEIKEDINDIHFIDDYAHHPSEIEASLKAIKNLKYNNMYLIFQPHTFTRTKALFFEFVRALSGDFNLLLAKIYAAREKDTSLVSSYDLVKEITRNKSNKNNICEYFETFKDIIEYVASKAKKGDLVVTMGAGDIYKIYDIYKEFVRK